MNLQGKVSYTKEQMLACPALMGAPRNQWYIAAMATEITGDPLARLILDDHILLYRGSDGQAVALEDRCPHRGVPLSMGTIHGDAVRCPYHGMEFDRSGACQRVPSQTTITPQLKVRVYPLIEVGPYVWIWMGDPEHPDEAVLPDQYELGLARPGFKITPLFVMEMGCNYQLLHENLLDVSHVTFLHEGLLDNGEMAAAPFTANYGGGRVKISRDLVEVPNPIFARTFGLVPGKLVNRTLITEAMPPQISLITNTFTDPEAPDAPPHMMINPQGITPSGDNRCFNFVAVSTSYADDQPADAVPHLTKLFIQDKIVLEAIQKRYEEEGADLREVSVKADAAALNFRRHMATMVVAERTVSSPQQASQYA